MGSLRMKRSDMDGDNASPFSSQKIKQIKKILHRDVDKELEQAFKIAKEINNRIYQVHRNILVYQKLNPTRKGTVLAKDKAAERESSSTNDASGEGSLSEKSCDSSKLEDVMRHIKTEPINEPSPSKTSISDQEVLEPSQSSSQNQRDNKIPEKNTANHLVSKLSSDNIKSFNFVPCSKCLASNKGSSQSVNNVTQDILSQNTLEKNTSDEISSQSSSVSEPLVSEAVDSKCAEIANSLWLVCLDHDYLKENVWAEQIKHRKSLQSSLNTEPAISIEASASCSSIISDSSPPRKRIKIESSPNTKSDSVTSISASASKLASSDSVLSDLGINDVKYDDFLNSSSYFDKDLVIFDQNPFNFNNIDLSICDISSLDFKDEYSGQINQAVSSSESVKDYTSNSNSQSSSFDPLKKFSSGNNTLNGTSPVKLRFTIGTVSKLLLASEKSCHETHIWKIYVRNTFAEDVPLDNYIAKIRFVIHDSYAPNNLIERKEPPFEITRRGWGEFPIRVQIFFRFNKKPICLVHQLSLVRNVINILTLGIQKNYEIIIPNLAKSFHPSKEADSSSVSGTQNNGQWKNSKCDSVVKDIFDFKIKEIDTVAKINELISQDTVPNVNETKKSEDSCAPSASPTLPFQELKSQLLGDRDFYTNFSDLNQMKALTSSIKNYCERILFLLDVLPIVTPYALLKWYKRVYTYACPSKKIFDSWPIGKQRASEFGRARMIKSLAASNTAEDWTTNEIVLFARNKDDHFRNDPVSKASLVAIAKTVALQQLSELENLLGESECNEVIDVV